MVWTELYVTTWEPLSCSRLHPLYLFTSHSVIQSGNRLSHQKHRQVFTRNVIFVVPSKSHAARFVPLVVFVVFPCSALCVPAALLLPLGAVKLLCIGWERTTSAETFQTKTPQHTPITSFKKKRLFNDDSRSKDKQCVIIIQRAWVLQFYASQYLYSSTSERQILHFTSTDDNFFLI